MEQLLNDLLSQATGAGSYLLILLVLLLCGLGLPLPEDFVLITGGYIAYQDEESLGLMIAVTYLGILGGDSIAFWLGRHFGRRLETLWPFRLFMTRAKRVRVERLFRKYGDKIVVGARFMPGVRAVTYFIAGGARMRYLRFLFFDGMAALISAPLFVFLGWHFGEDIEAAIEAAKRGQWAVILGILAVAALAIVVSLLRKRYAARAEAKRLSADFPGNPRLERPTPPPTAPSPLPHERQETP